MKMIINAFTAPPKKTGGGFRGEPVLKNGKTSKDKGKGMLRRKTKIKIDYTKCGDGRGRDPRECGICLRRCKPAVFLLHETLGAVEKDPCNPAIWRVTPLWPSLCTGCMECVDSCPEKALWVKPGRQLRALQANKP